MELDRLKSESFTWREIRGVIQEILNSDVEAKWIIEDIAGEGAYLLGSRPSEFELETVVSLVNKRQQGCPIQYVLSSWGFRTLNLKLRESVLIPRPETELLVSQALKELEEETNSIEPLNVLDLCCGSGAIGISILKELRRAKEIVMYFSDISDDAVKLTKENLSLNIDTLEEKCDAKFYIGDLFIPFKSAGILFDLITVNPPYVSEEEFTSLDSSVKNYEPKLALLGGYDGLDVIRRVIRDSRSYLKSDAKLIMEIGSTQALEVTKLAEDSEFYVDFVGRDLAELNRYIVLRKA